MGAEDEEQVSVINRGQGSVTSAGLAPVHEPALSGLQKHRTHFSRARREPGPEGSGNIVPIY